jgi:hypothetical protein
MSSRSVTAQGPTSDRTWLPELENRGLAYLLLGLSFVGGTTELATTAFVPRLALYALVLAVGAFGLIRRSRRARLARISLDRTLEIAQAVRTDAR